MRPPSHSSFRTPLDDILGTAASLRVLRALGREVRSQPQIGRQTGLSKPSISRAIQTLWEMGLLTTRGVGEPTAIKADHPIAAALLRLFDAERERLERVYDGLRAAVGPNVLSIWIGGKVARCEDTAADPLQVGVLVDAAALDQTRDLAEPKLAQLEKPNAVMIDIRYYTKADLATMTQARRDELSAALPLSGVAPSAFVTKPTEARLPRTHGDRDADALARARALVDLIAQDPTLVPRALAWLHDHLDRAGPSVARSLREWERILTAATPAQLRRFLTEESERATRLRQSNPFLPVLSPEERRIVRQNERR